VTDDLRHLKSQVLLKEAARYQAQRSVPPYGAQLHAASRAIEQRNVDPNGARAECIFMAMEIDMSYASFSKHFARARSNLRPPVGPFAAALLKGAIRSFIEDRARYLARIPMIFSPRIREGLFNLLGRLIETDSADAHRHGSLARSIV